MSKNTQNRNYGAGISKKHLNYEDPMLLLEIEGLARDGFDDQQIAQILDVSRQTFSRNKQKRFKQTSENPKGLSPLSLSLARGRRPLNVIIENSLYKRAIGQTVTETKVITKREWNEVSKKHERVVYEETTTIELPGDVAAITLWLRHRKPEIYNNQSAKVDVTSKGEKLPAAEAPKIAVIEHITISDTDIKEELKQQ